MSDPRPAFRDPALSREDRIADLLSRLTLDEKIGLLHQYHRPVERLGMGPFKTGTEALHGLAWLGEATVFPQVVALGATWNPGLVEQVGAAVADEVLAFNHDDPVKVGRNVWAPTVNPLRDPRWGRNEEGYSEDARMTGIMGAAYARGLKGDDGTTWKTAPTVKHFLAYGNEADRCVTSSNMPPRVLREYEFAAHRPALASGDAVAVMLSYNLVNGRPAHVTPLVNAELRTWSDDEIFIVSDAYAPNNLAENQGYFDDLPTAYAAAVKAGLDSFTQDDDRPDEVLAHLVTALDRGLLEEADIDTAVRRNLFVRFGLGEFDPEDAYAHIGREVVNSPEHQALAREAAAQSITLLSNDGILPLQAPKKIAVVGPFADTQMQDWYSGTLPYAITARDALAERADATRPATSPPPPTAPNSPSPTPRARTRSSTCSTGAAGPTRPATSPPASTSTAAWTGPSAPTRSAPTSSTCTRPSRSSNSKAAKSPSSRSTRPRTPSPASGSPSSTAASS
jgi:beta-glucosidase